jgi:SSS family solute:Na+ symporter
MFFLAAFIAIFYVKGMVSWFLFINSVMVIFILPLSWLRFFWWRFNVWGEVAAIILGLPLSIILWFILDFQSKPLWQGIGLLFLLSSAVLVIVSLLTPPESTETLVRFYERCRPPGLWKRIRLKTNLPPTSDPSLGHLLFDCLLGILSCLGLVLATNSLFSSSWNVFVLCIILALGSGYWLIKRILA